MVPVLGLLLLYAGDADAEFTIRPSGDGLILHDGDTVAFGGLGSIGFGYNLEMDPLLLVPEIYGSFGAFGGGMAGLLTRVLAGMRVGYAGPIEPSAFLRLGYGWTGAMWSDRGDTLQDWDGFHLQAGAAVEGRIDRSFTIGGHAYYDLGALWYGGGNTDEFHGVGLGITACFWL